MLLGCNVVGEVHITRKQYLDGSIPTGFQRTAIIGTDGDIPFAGRSVHIRQLSIEEDSCREVSDRGHVRTYRTDRLGMPLIEIVTDPDMKTPAEAMQVGQVIRWLCRASGLVRTGSGAARQDVNVSVTGGTRIEIKGVPSLRMIPRLTHNEALRQRSLVGIRSELERRGVTAATIDERGFDVTAAVRGTGCRFIRRGGGEGRHGAGHPPAGIPGPAGGADPDPHQLPQGIQRPHPRDRLHRRAAQPGALDPGRAHPLERRVGPGGQDLRRGAGRAGDRGLGRPGRHRDRRRARSRSAPARPPSGCPTRPARPWTTAPTASSASCPAPTACTRTPTCRPSPWATRGSTPCAMPCRSRPWERQARARDLGVGMDLAERLGRHRAWDLFAHLVPRLDGGPVSAAQLASLLLDRSCPRPASLVAAGPWWEAVAARLAAGTLIPEGVWSGDDEPLAPHGRTRGPAAPARGAGRPCRTTCRRSGASVNWWPWA